MVEVPFETVDFFGPKAFVRSRPALELAQRPRVEREHVLAAGPGANDEPRLFEHAEVAGHGRQGDRERRREVAGPRGSPNEAIENRAASGVGNRGRYLVEGCAWHAPRYLTCMLNDVKGPAGTCTPRGQAK